MTARSIFVRTLLLVAVPSVMLIALLGAFALAQQRQAEAQRWSLHTKDVLDTAQRLLTHLSDAQTGIRGFLIARDETYLQPYERAIDQIPATLHQLARLTSDNLQQQARVRRFERRTEAMLAHYTDALRQARSGGVSAERDTALVSRGKRLMDEFRSEVRAFRAEELRLDEVRRGDLERAGARLLGVVIGGTGAALFAVVGLGVWFHRSLSRRVTSLTTVARTLADGRTPQVDDTVDDELRVIDDALHEMARALAQRQRAVVGALADAVRLFSAAGTRRAVLDVAVDRAVALTGAGIALCTFDGDPHGTHLVVAAAASAEHVSSAPVPGTDFRWSGAEEVLRSGRPLRLPAAARADRVVPPDVERVLGTGEWIGVPLRDDRRTPIGILQVAAFPGRAFRDDDRDVIGTLAQAASVALALERSRQRLEAVNADLALTNRENELFIYSVSHDLRSPLVNLEGFSRELGTSTAALRRLLDAPDVPERVRQQAVPVIEQDVTESVHFIRTAVGRLASIIDGLLRLSRAGRVEYRIQPIALDEVLRRIVDAMHATVSSARADIRLSPLPRVAGDALAIEQLFANLVGNAINYARPDVAPRIEVATEDDLARDQAHTVIRVSDNGLGIAEAHLEKVFQPLQRLHPRVGTGEGMGLAIVRRIVERHGGRVWVRSEVGAGTTFYVELPREVREDAPHAA